MVNTPEQTSVAMTETIFGKKVPSANMEGEGLWSDVLSYASAAHQGMGSGRTDIKGLRGLSLLVINTDPMSLLLTFHVCPPAAAATYFP